MTSLPITPFVLQGGCFCKAITYTISVPPFASRPLIPEPPKRPFGPQNEVTERLPIISLDHCNSCRRISGAIVECWFICPQSWTSFSLIPRKSSSEPSSHQAGSTPRTTSEIVRPTKDLEEMAYVKAFQSSENAHRTFCGRCGTHLTFFYSGEDDDMAAEENWGPYFDIAVGTFDTESAEMRGLRPGMQSWWGEGIGWVREVLGESERSLSG
jgi:hypothetical protein